ncbi:esterase-like activity of phytase family protein [Sulfuricurvum sp.]|uniref:esterase-like activity of phytase family protein n=1 Tax=Sulfuricurvum sp. TaxID=2025608 RepID=UPI0019CE6B87|nr:esterase-like activity of phytase family protein [Sulfuricurvum sp.]MBD3798829.1 esterase-like activity of phytase family protein [Campylobacterota bacterium]MBD3806514.1 esterase-like activity of phytase family protein [Sulfuricurvum sp.]
MDLVANAQASDGNLSSEIVNMATFLQSLDSDLDPNNGISIASDLRTKFKAIAPHKIGADSNLTKLILDANVTGIALKNSDVAIDHLISTVAKVRGTTGMAKRTFQNGNISEITQFTVDTTRNDINYTLTTDMKKMPLAVGSSLRLKSNTNGTMVFYGITDRGPNGDSPEGSIITSDGNYTRSKSFPVPTFVPTIAEITVKGGKASVTKTIPLKASASVLMSGLPLQSGVGSTGEVALDATLGKVLEFNPNGIDPEGIDIDSSGKLWIGDEYGPFIAQVDPISGVVLQKFVPGSGLPDMLKRRVPNRGIEGLAIAPDSGKIYGIVQTPLDTTDDNKDKGDDTWLTLVELDPNTKEVNLYAVAFDAYDKTKNPNGFEPNKVKVGDLMALGNNQFMMIEQGKNNAKKLVNNLVKIDISKATKITSDMYDGKKGLKEIKAVTVTPATRTFIANLRTYGWLAEKAEGLSKIDDQTIAIINDNDFGMKASAKCSVNGVEEELDPEKLTLNLRASINQLGTTENVTCDSGSISYTLTKNAEYERRTRLWIIKLSKAMTSF